MRAIKEAVRIEAEKLLRGNLLYVVVSVGES